METTEADWSSLPYDLLEIIAKLTLMASVKSFIAFRSTCSSWNEATRDECTKLFRWPRVPFLMIPDKVEFYSPSKKKSYFLKKPLPEGKSRKFIESRFGWILTLETSGKANLFYPFSEKWIQLPNYKTLPKDKGNMFSPPTIPKPNYEANLITRSVLSANPSETSNYVLSVLTHAGYIAFWRPGNHNWTRLKSSSVFEFVDLIFLSTDCKLYAINLFNKIWCWDMDTDSEVEVTAGRVRIACRYLVESSAAELLLVGTNLDRLLTRNRIFEVYRLNFKNGAWERVTRLKDAIFVGCSNASFCILPNHGVDPFIRSSCIYFIHDDMYFRNEKGIYRLEDGSIQRFPENVDRLEDGSIQRFPENSFTSFPIWICPSSFPFMALLEDQKPYLKMVVIILFVAILTIIGFIFLM